MKKMLIITVLFFFSYAISFAEDIYVAQTAAGGNTGLNCSNAHSATWFNTSSNWGVGVNKISPGDTVHLCGTIATALTVQGSGSSGSPITVYFESGAKLSKPSWNGKALTSSKDYIIIDGGTNGIIENTDNGTVGSYGHQDYIYGISAMPCNHCEIKNLTVQNMYIRTSTTDEAPIWNNLVGINIGGTGTLVHDNIIHDAGAALIYSYNDGDTDVKVYNNTMYHCSHNFVLASGGNTHGGDFYFYNNYVYDYSPWDHATCKYHSSGIHAFGTQSGGYWPDVDNFYIYNNLFEQPGNCPSGHIFLEGRAQSGIYTPWVGSTGTAYIFNNIAKGSAIIALVGSGHVIANNTVINGAIKTDTSNPTIKNNYVSGTGAQIGGQPIGYATATSVTPANIDYNMYAYSYGYNLWACPGQAATGNWTTYRSKCSGYDAHSYNHTLSGTGGDTAGINQSNGRPEVGSNVIDHGVDLSGLGIKFDKDGVSRPQGAGWDIGAYKYKSVTAPAPAPAPAPSSTPPPAQGSALIPPPPPAPAPDVVPAPVTKSWWRRLLRK